jgi:hypothetical protein
MALKNISSSDCCNPPERTSRPSIERELYELAIPNSGMRTGNVAIFVFGLLLMMLMVLPQFAAAEPLPPTTNCGEAYSQCTAACGINPNLTTGDNVPSYSDWLSCNSSCSSDQAKCNTTPIQHPVSPPCVESKPGSGNCQNAPGPVKPPPAAKCKGEACNAAPIGSKPQGAK